MNITALVGHPSSQSRTRAAAERLGKALEADVRTIDLVDLGTELLDWTSVPVAEAVTTVAQSDIVIVATPTFKATYTGILKLFLDRFAGQTGLAGVVAVPLQLGASALHALSPQQHLVPLLVELGATVPAPALYLIADAEQPDPVEHAWVERWGPTIRAAAEHHAHARTADIDDTVKVSQS